MTNKELFMFSNRNKGGGGTSPVPPEPSPPDVPYSDWILLAEIPSGTTVIPANAFNGFSNLRNVVINDGLTTIGNYAFYDCTSLKDIEIPDSVTEIGTQAIGYGENGKISDVIIYGNYETTAEEYAVASNIEFIAESGTFTWEKISGTQELPESNPYDHDVVFLSGYTPLANKINQKVATPTSREGTPVAYARRDIFNGKNNITELIIKNPFAGFIWTPSSANTYLPNTLTKLRLPKTLVFLSDPLTTLAACSNLQEIVLEVGFSYPLVCSNCPLTQQSLVGMLNALADLTGEQAKTLTVGNANLAKLTNEQIAIATEKNWTLA